MHEYNNYYSPYLKVTIIICNLVQIQECLVDAPLELQGSLHSLKLVSQATPPNPRERGVW